jgi:hypothetical protein
MSHSVNYNDGGIVNPFNRANMSKAYKSGDKLCSLAKMMGLICLIIGIALLIAYTSIEFYKVGRRITGTDKFKSGRRSNLTLRSLKPRQTFGGRRSYLEGIAQSDGCAAPGSDPCLDASDLDNAQTGGATMRSCSVGSQPGMGGGKTSCGLYATGTTESFSGGANHDTYNQGMRSRFNPYGGETTANKLNQAMTGR